MKIKSLFLAVAFVLTSIVTLNAQDRQNPWTIEIGTNAVDFYPVGGDSGTMANGSFSAQIHGSFWNEYFNFGDHYNFMPSASRVAVGVTYSVGSA